MGYIVNYNKYCTENPYEDKLLYEGKGVPNVLKYLADEVYDKVMSSSFIIMEVDESDLKLNLKVNKTDQKRNDMYATSRFGQFKNGRLNPDINIFFLILIILMELN